LQHATRNDGVSCALRADPEGRCVAMRIYGDQLAVLPLGSGSNQASSFVVDMRGAGAARGIRDCVFLAGYLAPTLALLHEPDAMWAGTLDAAADSCALTVVSLDLARRAVAPLSTVGRLPYDSRALVAVPAPIGGVLVLGAGAISHVANGAVACVAVLNRAAARGIGAALADCIDRASEGLGLVLDPRCCACVFVAPATAALWTQQGCCFLLTLASVGGRGVRRIIARQVAGPALGAADAQAPVSDAWGDVSVVPSCVAELRVSYDDEDSDGRRRDALLVFVGGTAGRSVLLEVIEVKRRQQQQQQQPMTMTMMDVDADFYGSGEPGESDQDALRLAVADELLGTGPAAALEVGVKAGGGGGDDESLELVTCAGNEWRGRLRVQQRHVAPAVVAALDVPGAPVRGVWTARCVAEYNIGGVMQAAASGADAAPALLGDRFLVVSRDASTAAFAVSSSGDELSELDHRAGFFTRGATVAVAELRACTRVVQVHARGMRVVAASGRETQAVDVAVDADAEIVAAEVADPLVLLRLASGAYAAYEAAADSGELRPVPVPADALRRAVHVSLFRDAHR
ncbi:mRNA cleavage and polyadenylation factor subunit, partial [Coemansia sp. RSA 1694]